METIVIDKYPVALPCHLNPVRLLELFKGVGYVRQARFKTNLLITYHPNVPATTAGVTAFAVTRDQKTDADEIARSGDHVITAVWKKASLNVSKNKLNVQQWSQFDTQSYWLSSANVHGSITISGTIQAHTYRTPKELAMPEGLIEIDTRAIVGPRLAGFSLSFYASDYPQQNSTGGFCMNIDLQNSTGITTTARYIRTPEARPYIVVRYGWHRFSFTYNSQNKQISWKSNGSVIQSYDNSSSSNSGYKPDFWGSWAAIHGSTSWWCETIPDQYTPVGGTYTPLRRSYAVLFLYYDYGQFDIFATSFGLTPDVTPGVMQPYPGPTIKPGVTKKLTLNGFNPFLMASADWKPTLTDRESSNKKQLIAWPHRYLDELYALRDVESCPDATVED